MKNKSTIRNIIQAFLIFVSGLWTALTFVFDVNAYIPGIDQVFQKLFGFLVFSAIIIWIIVHQQEIIDAKTPHVVMKNDPWIVQFYSVQSNNNVKLVSYAKIPFFNKPKYPTKDNHAKNVIGSVKMYHANNGSEVETYTGQWACQSSSLADDLTLKSSFDISSSGEECTLAVAFFSENGHIWTNYDYYKIGEIDVDGDDFYLFVTLTGEMLFENNTWWFRLTYSQEQNEWTILNIKEPPKEIKR